MADLRITSMQGADTVLKETAIEGFSTSLRGELLRSADAGYDYNAARKVWNAMIDKHPALIVRCAGVADVITAVNFARTHNLLIAVRGGGHNVAGNGVCDGGLMIDLSRIKGMRVDPVHRSARAEPGLTWGEFDRESSGVRPCHSWRHHLHDGDRGAHAGWRLGLARPLIRLGLR